MRAIVFNDTELSYQPHYTPKPIASAVEVEVLQAGICDTDLQLIRGYMGFSGVLGHEFVGIAKSGRFEGQRVVGEINCACLNCDSCVHGFTNHCPHRTVVGILNHDGAFAESVWIPEKNLHAIPESISNDEAVFVEPLAAAFQIPSQLDLSQLENIVVLGDGRLGNLCAQVIARSCEQLLVVGKHSEKLKRLSSHGIATSLLSEVNTGRTADLVVDCTGSPSGLSTAFQIIKPRGTIVLKSTFADQEIPNLAPIVIEELNIVGSRCGPFKTAIESLTLKEIDVTSLITSRFSIESAIDAFEAAQQKDQLKVILEINC